jgi:hypothetical protein
MMCSPSGTCSPSMTYESVMGVFQKADCPFTWTSVFREDLEEAILSYQLYEEQDIKALSEIEDCIFAESDEEKCSLAVVRAAAKEWSDFVTDHLRQPVSDRRRLHLLSDSKENSMPLPVCVASATSQVEWCDKECLPIILGSWAPPTRLLDLSEMAADMSKFDYDIMKTQKKYAFGALVEKDFTFKNCSFVNDKGYSVAETAEGDKIYVKSHYLFGGRGMKSSILGMCGGYLEGVKEACLRGYVTIGDVSSKMPYRIDHIQWVKVV